MCHHSQKKRWKTSHLSFFFSTDYHCFVSIHNHSEILFITIGSELLFYPLFRMNCVKHGSIQQLQLCLAMIQKLYKKIALQVLYAWRKSDTTDPEFVERRRAGLENFLLRVASHPILGFDDQFINFLQQEHGWRETITDSGEWKGTLR